MAFDGEVVAQLRSQAVDAFRLLPKRGAEVGGLLLGHVESREPLTLRIGGSEPIPTEHRYGPSYTLSESDRVNLTRALSRRRLGSPPVIGFYRSYTGREASLDTADQELIRTYFADPHCAFLLIKPDTPHGCVGTFLFWKDGQLPTQPRYPEFSLNVDQAPLPREEAAPEEPAPAPPVESRRPRLWLPLLLCLAASIAVVFVYELWKLAREPRWIQLGLDATPAANGLEVSWDRAAPAVQGASRGVLSIADGGIHRDIELTSAQVQEGKILYRPSQDDVLFRLKVYGAGIKPAGDSFRIVNLPKPAPAAPPEPAPPAESASRMAEPPPSVPPGALRQVQPQIPDGIRSRIQNRIVVPVQVRVNESGRVVKATSQGDGDGLYRYLATQSEKAARRWRFAPARSKKGKRVPATKTIYFTFTR